MKDKLNLFVCMLVLAFMEPIYAQQYYVNGTDVSAGDIVYEVQRAPGTIMLENAANELSDRPITRLDGTELTDEEYADIPIGTPLAGTFDKALQSTFTEDEYQQLVEGKALIRLFIVKRSDGRMAEVAFFIRESPQTAALPPEKYALLEKNRKEYVRYWVTEEEKQLNFTFVIMHLNFAKMRLFYVKPGGGTPIGPDAELKE